jgi:hypothetical protein
MHPKGRNRGTPGRILFPGTVRMRVRGTRMTPRVQGITLEMMNLKLVAGALVVLVNIAFVFPQAATPGGPASPQTSVQIRRLILKDGSFENVIRYEIKGDRVRFLSAERREWEEMPISLIDWPASEKYARDAGAEKSARLHELSEETARERAESEAASPTVAPGLRLPDTGGVFLLDTYQDARELTPVHQNGADINSNRGANILRGIINPVAGSKQTIELKGRHAAVQSHVTEPAFYLEVDLEGDYTPRTAQDHFRMVRCEPRKGTRVVGAINVAVYGKVKQQAGYIQTTVEPVAGRWVRITPADPLDPGEYALVEMLGSKGMNTFVWDFGVNADAPPNAEAQRSASAKPGHEPVLLKRKKN